MNTEKNSMKIALVLGTRPEIIKMSPIIRELEKQNVDFFIIHTNQHYSEGMDGLFFRELNLKLPKYNLGIHDLPQGAMVGKMLQELEPILIQENPGWVLVQGDTNSVLAGSLAAAKLQIKVGHIEAGLRSYDRTMPEELNRIVTDHLSEALFCPTEQAAIIAKKEGINSEKIFMTGNTIVDAVRENQMIIPQEIESKYQTQEYLLLTMHRTGNVDDAETLERLIRSLEVLSRQCALPILFPVHPHTAASLAKFNIKPASEHFTLLEPVGYLEMLSIMRHSRLIITDSGGVQEEACILHIPCITIRDNTERPETVVVGANKLVGSDREAIVSGGLQMLKSNRTWESPFGNGKTAELIIGKLTNKLIAS